MASDDQQEQASAASAGEGEHQLQRRSSQTIFLGSVCSVRLDATTIDLTGKSINSLDESIGKVVGECVAENVLSFFTVVTCLPPPPPPPPTGQASKS